MLSILDFEEIVNKIEYQELESKTILITGANGFLASNIVDFLMYLNEKYLVKKCKVIALCRNRNKAEKIFAQYLYDKCFTLLIQNVEEKIILEQKVNYVIHAASNAATSDFEKIPVNILEANIIGTYNLLDFFKDRDLDSFLFFSSGAVYGETPLICHTLQEEQVYNLKFREIQNCYAEGKRAGEALCSAYWKQFGVPTKVVRISHTYGPGIDLYDGRIFSDFVRQICNNEDLVIKGTGMDSRPFCYITDAITAFFIILFKGNNGEVYNMANRFETVTIYELAKILVEKAFPERRLKIEAKNLHLKKENNRLIVDTSRLEKLGWMPQINIIEGFKRTVESFEGL